MRPVFSIAGAFTIAAVTFCGGCRRGDSDGFLKIEELAELPALSTTAHPGLQQEYGRLSEEGGTPRQLARREVPDPANVAVALAEAFPSSSRQLRSLLDDSWELLPARGFEFDAAALARISEFRARHRQLCEAVRAALKRPRCELGIEHLRGPLADSSNVDRFVLAGRLESFAAAEALADGQSRAALDAWEAMLRLAECLAAEWHPVARLEGAYLRSEALAVAEAIANRRNASRAELDRMAKVVADLLASWPDDARAWIGDRAVGLFYYEAARRGRLADLLGETDLAALGGREVVGGFGDPSRYDLDADQLFYLVSMRAIIDGCREPYYRRRAVFDEIDRQLAALEATDGYPLVAGKILLADVQKGHLVQARDRANWEGWSCALTAALGENVPDRTNPLTGQPYRIERDDGRVVVRGIGSSSPGDDTPVVVPLLPR